MFSVANTLAYYEWELLTSVKSFIVQAGAFSKYFQPNCPEPVHLNFFTLVIDANLSFLV
jgi:hypothetical protein